MQADNRVQHTLILRQTYRTFSYSDYELIINNAMYEYIYLTIVRMLIFETIEFVCKNNTK